jgi:hypothetical protein
MKDVASQNENRPTRLIVQEKQATISDEAAALLPTYDALRQRLLNIRLDPYSNYCIGETPKNW